MGVNIMLALGSLVMFATFLGSSNKVMIGNSQIASQNEYYIAALSYGQSVIDEAKTKSYEGTISTSGTKGVITTKSLLLGPESASERITWVDTLGPKGYASEQRFDDVDDYLGYRRRVNSPRAEGYEISATVNWVDETDPNSISTSMTDYKMMVVKVTSPYFPKIERGGVTSQDTLKLTYFFNR